MLSNSVSVFTIDTNISCSASASGSVGICFRFTIAWPSTMLSSISVPSGITPTIPCCWNSSLLASFLTSLFRHAFAIPVSHGIETETGMVYPSSELKYSVERRVLSGDASGVGSILGSGVGSCVGFAVPCSGASVAGCGEMSPLLQPASIIMQNESIRTNEIVLKKPRYLFILSLHRFIAQLYECSNTIILLFPYCDRRSVSSTEYSKKHEDSCK